MADISFEGMDDAIRALDAAGEFDDQLISDMLHAGAEIVVQQIQTGITRSRFKLDGYAGSVQAARQVKRTRKDKDPYLTVTANGKNEKGTRRAEILFVLNYGRREEFGRIEPGYFWTLATQKAQAPAAKAMEAVLEEKYKKEGL